MNEVRDYIISRMSELIGNQECSPVDDYLYQVAKEVQEKFDTQCVVRDCDGFQSFGYEIECYSISFIEKDGKLDVLNYKKEWC